MMYMREPWVEINHCFLLKNCLITTIHCTTPFLLVLLLLYPDHSYNCKLVQNFFLLPKYKLLTEALFHNNYILIYHDKEKSSKYL